MRITAGGSRKAAPNISIGEYIETLIRDGIVAIPCPHGRGEYTIDIRPLSLEKALYGTPILIFASKNKSDEYGLKAAPAYLRTNVGRQILWYPVGLGIMGYHEVKVHRHDPEYQVALAKMLVGVILSGRRLYALACGENINSWETDAEALAYREYYEDNPNAY